MVYGTPCTTMSTKYDCILMGTPNGRQMARIVDEAFGTPKSVSDGGQIAEEPGFEATGVPLVASDLKLWSRGTSYAHVLDGIAEKLFDVYTRNRAEVDGLAAENGRPRSLVSEPRPAARDRRSAVTAADYVDLMTRVRNAVRNAGDHDLKKRLALVTNRLKAVDKDKHDLLDVVHRNRPTRPTATETEDSLRVLLDKVNRKNEHLQAVVDDLFNKGGMHD